MTRLGREIILGVGGGVSAYKSAELLRRLQEHGLEITVVPTLNSLNFVGKVTWEALSGKPAQVDLWDRPDLVEHIHLAKSTQAIVIAPTTANLLAKLANGIADDLLTNIFISSTAPKILVPAMHTEMWLNPATLENVVKLRERGVLVIEPEVGRMTGTDEGIGRYPEISNLVSQITKYLEVNSDYSGKKIVVTAGGTREFLDPVRYIGNISSGKQGVAIAQAAISRGAQVVLIGANIDPVFGQNLTFISVTSASEMLSALINEVPGADLLLMAAAVADVKPEQKFDSKIKKPALKEIKLVANEDLLSKLSGEQLKAKVIIGFAAETSKDPTDEAKRKLQEKRLDFIYANDVSGGAIFGSERTKGVLISKQGHTEEIPEMNKVTLAHLLLDRAKDKLG